MSRLTSFDKRLLSALQHDFPRVSRPFAAIAAEIGSDEETVLQRVIELKKAGYIRKLGAFVDSTAMGRTGTLVAVAVAPERLPEVAEAVNREAGVTHNYEREGEYNLWFTLQTQDSREKAELIAHLREMDGVKKLLDLPSEKKYKIRVELPLE